MLHKVNVGKKTRMSFSSIHEILDMPDLIEVQKDSYRHFIEKGLGDVLDDISPIKEDVYKRQFLSLDFNARNYVRIAADGSTTQLAHSDGLQGWSSSMVYNREDGKCYIFYTNMQNGDDTSSVEMCIRDRACSPQSSCMIFIRFLSARIRNASS